jgi:hypothetical protein
MVGAERGSSSRGAPHTHEKKSHRPGIVKVHALDERHTDTISCHLAADLVAERSEELVRQHEDQHVGITRRVAYIGHSSHVFRELGEGCPAARGPDDDAYSRALAAGEMRLTRELYYRFSCTKITAGFLAGAY